MLRTASLLAILSMALSAGSDADITVVVAAQLLGGWGLTETGLSPASQVRLIWTHPVPPLLPAAPTSRVGRLFHAGRLPATNVARS